MCPKRGTGNLKDNTHVCNAHLTIQKTYALKSSRADGKFMQYIVYRVLTIIILPVFCFGISSVQLMIALLESIDIDIVKFLIISIFFMRDIENFAFGIYSFSRNFVGLSLFEHC